MNVHVGKRLKQTAIEHDFLLLSSCVFTVQDLFRLIGAWGDRHVLLFCQAIVITKKRKDGSLQAKVIIKASKVFFTGYDAILIKLLNLFCISLSVS
jgi:hypothetical protein